MVFTNDVLSKSAEKFKARHIIKVCFQRELWHHCPMNSKEKNYGIIKSELKRIDNKIEWAKNAWDIAFDKEKEQFYIDK